MTKRRVCILLMDSLGIGASLDATDYGDAGADTFGHILEACDLGHANANRLKQGPLNIPHLKSLGLYHAALASSGNPAINLATVKKPQSYYGYAVEQSLGKDTPSGHWELAGVPVTYEWGYFPNTLTCFPQALITKLITKAQLPGVLGLKHASGTTIIAELGEEHIKTKKTHCVYVG